MTAAVEIYTTPTCGYCRAAKSLLARKNVSYKEIDVATDRALREAMVKRANGRTTVPQIFINDAHVGGCDDLYALDQAGKLDPLLAGEETVS
ncbi:glutaredoxin 3 [Bradyrhizobium sp. U87765 SZCCT0131]|uniref:glutaredoxin 3 n=1 Tax=unclassified Bradyrhizobium TaxID=2631580 RepID=UPI001BADAABC|nr:glutaredoxin 3 [Bradyrhizobium sp. U87765 SZCCT0131]MBR1259128.1 glutaredoxin 3 [Bradyrhizobium sp. U87765 SZCCT0134]MBR1305269.1 glutaredoxin 3 [Bradyrhizobium sp. U87765 SZCCT0110]MBR1321055.1 glutaredoxin 3 [Bradyrhizobium sp. U87765 SZCCT0109]MBR1350291.1 glutaredoxin 3 [Bradyrhizobium sp. U87765 SZCCT0048]